MSGETVLTVVGNATSDPELRYTQNGKPVASFTVAAGERIFDRVANEWKDGETLFMRCSAWGDLAEHVAGSIVKGTRVLVLGALKQRSYDTKPTDGSAPVKRTSTEMRVMEIGPSLKYATAQITRLRAGDNDSAASDQFVPSTVGAMV